MSRIGRKHIAIPAGVEVKLDGTLVTVKGPKGTLQQNVHPSMTVKVEGAEVIVERPDDAKENRSLHGLTRTLIANMVEGVTNGYAKTLEIVGVGYKAAVANGALNLALGYSHPIVFKEENGITFECPNSNVIVVKGIDKQLVGQIAAQIREKRPPEPYLGKGVKYQGEHIRRKAGKTGK